MRRASSGAGFRRRAGALAATAGAVDPMVLRQHDDLALDDKGNLGARVDGGVDEVRAREEGRRPHQVGDSVEDVLLALDAQVGEDRQELGVLVLEQLAAHPRRQHVPVLAHDALLGEVVSAELLHALLHHARDLAVGEVRLDLLHPHLVGRLVLVELGEQVGDVAQHPPEEDGADELTTIVSRTSSDVRGEMSP